MNTTVIPVQFKPTQFKKIEIIPDEIEELSFSGIAVHDGSSEIKISEANLEEFIRKNIQIIFPQESETLLIVGQQVVNKEGGRSDLVAIDKAGNIVLIELKRDSNDMALRKEALEFQAIRYAANYALITEPEDVVQKLFAPYVEKHRGEYGKKELTASQLAQEILDDFLQKNNINDFNQKQRIVLIASSFDDQTLSACAWLAKNEIDLRCLRVSPIRYGQQYFLVIEQVIPPPDLEEYFVEVVEPSAGKKKSPGVKQKAARDTLPRMSQLFEWGLIKPGDEVYISTNQSEAAEVVDRKNVKYKGQIMTFNKWGQTVTGWSAINIYEWTYLKSNGKSLDDLRQSKMEESAKQDANVTNA